MKDQALFPNALLCHLLIGSVLTLQFEKGSSSSSLPSNFRTSSQGHLNVVETNPFKHLTHLSLQFVPGNDADVKKYLASCLKKTMVSFVHCVLVCVCSCALILYQFTVL